MGERRRARRRCERSNIRSSMRDGYEEVVTSPLGATANRRRAPTQSCKHGCEIIKTERRRPRHSFDPCGAKKKKPLSSIVSVLR